MVYELLDLGDSELMNGWTQLAQKRGSQYPEIPAVSTLAAQNQSIDTARVTRIARQAEYELQQQDPDYSPHPWTEQEIKRIAFLFKLETVHNWLSHLYILSGSDHPIPIPTSVINPKEALWDDIEEAMRYLYLPDIVRAYYYGESQLLDLNYGTRRKVLEWINAEVGRALTMPQEWEVKIVEDYPCLLPVMR